jgi:hypothetical protein
MSKYYHLLVLNAPLIAEVVRKYYVWNDMVFFAGDLLALTTFLVLLASGDLRGRLPATFWWLLPILVVWIFVQQAVTGHNLGILGIGARATFFPLVYLFLSASFIARFRDAVRLLFWCATAWVIVAGAMAVMQIYLGINDPINSVWGERTIGVGDYTGTDEHLLVKGLFRPTSIFTHTGKFGQVAFLLVLFRWSVHAFSGIHFPKWAYALVAVDLVTIFASGQRGAFVFLLLSLLAMAYFAGRRSPATLTKWFAGVTALGVLVVAFVTLLPGYGAAVTARFESAVLDIPARLEGNLFLPIAGILRDHLLLGEGFGYFSLGARIFGGQIAYLTLHLEGLGESSFIRLCGEIGLVGALLLAVMYLSVFAQALRVMRANASLESAASAGFYVLWIASLLLWCNTADVFGNTVGTFMGYALSGAVLLPASRKLARRSQG